jgi:UMF1 family MFS transporter
LQAVFRYRLSFVVVALFFALFAVPTFLLLPERPSARQVHRWGEYVKAGFRRVTGTLQHLRRYRETGKFVLAVLFFYGGIETVIKFSSIYATVSFGITGLERLLLFIFANLVAVPGTLFAGWLADRIGGRRAIAVTLVFWFVLLAVGALATQKAVFWAVAGGIAIGMGSTQAIGRSLMSQLSPPEKESEFFGFYILASKVGSIFALLLFGVISSGTGNQRLAVLWLLPLFAAGLVLVLAVRLPPPAPAGPRSS